MNNIEKVTGKIRECTSCQFCSAVCPFDAIGIKLDLEGFYTPFVIEDRCVNCGICVKYCYKYAREIERTVDPGIIVSYSAVAKDAVLVEASTSGGISTVLMRKCLELGYHVVGVAYDYESDTAVARVTSDSVSVSAFKGSKYMQAYTRDAYLDVLENNKNAKYAVFGVPCHIYPLYRHAATIGNEDRYLFIDLFCHGCPTMKLWRKYIDSVKGELKTDRFETVSFRSKRKGWHEYIHSFVAGNKEYVSAGAVKDPFFTIFFDNHVLNGSCYECELRSTMEYTDIRLGDYWGAKHGLDSKGVSAVALSSQRGVNLFDEIATDVEFRSTCFEDIIAAQSYALNYEFKQKARQRTLNLLDSDLDMWEIYRDYLKGYDMKMKIKRQARIAFSLLPRVLRFRCKTLYHRITT